MAMSREQQDEQAKAYGRLVAKAWSDGAFKQRLMADPAAVLKEEGVAFAEGIELRVVENTDNVVHLTRPGCRRDGMLHQEHRIHHVGRFG